MTTLTLEMPDSAADQIQALQRKAGLSDTRDLLARAFALLDTVLDHQLEGGQITFHHTDGTTEYLLSLIAPIPHAQ